MVTKSEAANRAQIFKLPVMKMVGEGVPETVMSGLRVREVSGEAHR